MKAIKCELCGGNELIKQDDYFVCQFCGTKYTVEQARKMMIEGLVDVSGSTVKVDNSSFVQKYIENARRALNKCDWSEVEKYYNLVEQNDPENIEAIFFSAYGKLRNTIVEDYSQKWDAAFSVMDKSISVLDDYFNISNEEVDAKVIRSAMEHILILTEPEKNNVVFGSVLNNGAKGVKNRTAKLYPQMLQTIDNIIDKYVEHNMDYSYLEKIKGKINSAPKQSACYVATAVYGSYDCPEVWTLRRFRDYTLAETWYGRTFIKTYYAISPTLVNLFGEKSWFKNIFKKQLDIMVKKLNTQGVESTPYIDKNW